jgi:hypothetical protein
MRDNTQNSEKEDDPRQLVVAGSVRPLAEEALQLGQYGTLTNTVRVALNLLLERLKENPSERISAASAA